MKIMLMLIIQVQLNKVKNNKILKYNNKANKLNNHRYNHHHLTYYNNYKNN